MTIRKALEKMNAARQAATAEETAGGKTGITEVAAPLRTTGGLGADKHNPDAQEAGGSH